LISEPGNGRGTHNGPLTGSAGHAGFEFDIVLRGPVNGGVIRHPHVSSGSQAAIKRHYKLSGKNQVRPAPVEIDRRVARLKLAAMGIEIGELTAERRNYLSPRREGT
jgi:hypothetical protein